MFSSTLGCEQKSATAAGSTLILLPLHPLKAAAFRRFGAGQSRNKAAEARNEKMQIESLRLAQHSP
jgi:hypothetical protein